MEYVFPIMFVLAIPLYVFGRMAFDHFSDMHIAMEKYKYYYSKTHMIKKKKYNSSTHSWEIILEPFLDHKVLTEDEYQKGKIYYDQGQVRRVRRTDFKH